MAIGFTAFIDESGDEGFRFLDPPKRASTQWFVLSAIIVRESRRVQEILQFKNFLSEHYQGDWPNLHFHKLTHEQRVAITHYLSRRRFRVISVCWDKRAITDDDREHTLDNRSRLHHYCIRFLLERISWLTREHSGYGIRAEQCRLIFSKCKNLKYRFVRDYLDLLCGQATEIDWRYLDAANFKVRGANELLGLKAADAVASGIRLGLELNVHQLCIDNHCRHLRSITYNRNGNYLSYGLKIMPRIPAIEQERDNRYAWINEYRKEDKGNPDRGVGLL